MNYKVLAGKKILQIRAFQDINYTRVEGDMVVWIEDGILQAEPLRNLSSLIRNTLGWQTKETEDFLLAQELIIEIAQDTIEAMEKVIATAIKAKKINQLPEIGE